jgi:hypothetical protein
MTEQTLPQTETGDNAPKADSMDLTISDLSAMKTIIDVASSRGSFKPNEMVTVGQVYTKLSNFLDSVAKQAPQAPGASVNG